MNKKYGLVWEDHPEPIEEQLKTHHLSFEEVVERRLELGKEGSPQHLLIEGDNYESLTLLKEEYEGKVDVIYIDPPYNTGKDFVYNDDFVGKDDDWRHSKWLSFMCKRLLLAKDLLKENGVIIISIDEHERSNLEALGNKVFPNNFIGEIIWDKRSQKGGASAISTSHEHLLFFSKTKEFSFNLIEKPNYKKMMNKLNSLIKKEGKKDIPESLLKQLKKVTNLNKKQIKEKYPEFFIEFTQEVIQKEFSNWVMKESIPDGEAAYQNICFEKQDLFQGTSLAKPDNKGYRYEIFHPITNKVCNMPENGWVMPYETYQEWLKRGRIIFGENETTQPRKKLYFSENSTEKVKSIFPLSKGGRTELKELGLDFSYPKPTDLIKHLLSLFDNNIVILDFFAGSGTTGHAVLELNKEDGGNRQFILCTNNENNICEEVTYERLKRVITGYTTPKGKEVEGIPANLKYLKTKLEPKEEEE